MRTKEEYLEIYRQRYETFRHLDRMRWAGLQYVIGVMAATAVVAQSTSGTLPSGVLALVGIALALLSLFMFKVTDGLIENQKVLSKAAKEIGDASIPDVSNRFGALSFWIPLLILVCGVAIGVWGILLTVFK